MKIVRKIKNALSVKTPVPYPVFEGELLEKRSALITGGGSGIGYAIAESFLKNGADVIICGRNEQKLQSAISKLEKKAKKGQRVSYLTLDISDMVGAKMQLDKYLKKEKVDILVNNAGTSKGESIGRTSVEDYEKLMKTNLEGTYFMSQYFLNYMRDNKIKGNILNVASASSLRPANSPYIISKWGVLGLTKGLAKTAIKYGIVVNGIAPGPTATAMLGNEDSTDIKHNSNPSGRFAMPEEIANLCTILVSDMGKMIVGDVLFATGGAGTITYDDMEY